jgi:hypothetical protein
MFLCVRFLSDMSSDIVASALCSLADLSTSRILSSQLTSARLQLVSSILSLALTMPPRSGPRTRSRSRRRRRGQELFIYTCVECGRELVKETKIVNGQVFSASGHGVTRIRCGRRDEWDPVHNTMVHFSTLLVLRVQCSWVHATTVDQLRVHTGSTCTSTTVRERIVFVT